MGALIKLIVQTPDKPADVAVWAEKYQPRGPALCRDLLWVGRKPPKTFGVSPGGCLRGDCASQGGSGPPATSALWVKVPAWRWVTAILLGQRRHPLPKLPSLIHLSGSLGNREVKMPAESSQGCHSSPCKAGVIKQTRCSAWRFNGWLSLQCLGTLWQGAVKGQGGTNSRCVFQQPQPEIVLYIADKQSTSAPCLCLHFIELSPRKQRNPSWLNSTFIIWISPVSFPVSMVP